MLNSIHVVKLAKEVALHVLQQFDDPFKLVQSFFKFVLGGDKPLVGAVQMDAVDV